MKKIVFSVFLLSLSSTYNADWKSISKNDAKYKKIILIEKNKIPRNCLIEGDYYEFSGTVRYKPPTKKRPYLHKVFLFISNDNSKPTCIYIKNGNRYQQKKATILVNLLNTKIRQDYKKAIFKGKLSVKNTRDNSPDYKYLYLNVTSWETPK